MPQSPAYRLAKVVGILAIMASAVSQEYGSGINFVATQSLSVYPSIRQWVPLAMFVTGLFYLPKVILFMRFGKIMPRSGGSYVWITRSLGMRIGFVVHFLWWASLSFAMGVLAYAFGSFLGTGLVSAGIQAGAVFTTPVGHLVAGLAAIWLVFWLHYRGIDYYSTLVSLLLLVVLASAAMVIGVGMGTSPLAFPAAVQAKLGLSLLAPKTTAPFPSPTDFLAVCTLFIFAYGGISAAPFLGGEAKDAERSVPRGIFWAWLTAILLFTLVAEAVFHAAPWWAVVQLIKAGKAAYTTTPGLVGLLAPHGISAALNLMVALIVAKTVAPQMLGTSRVVFAWAEDHLFPSAFAKTSRYKTPTAALLLSAVIGTVSLVQSTFVGWSIGVTFRSISILLVLFLTGLGILYLRWGRRFRQTPWAEPISRGPAVLVAAFLSLLIPVALIGSVLIAPKTPLVFQPAFQSLIAILIGLVIFSKAVAKAKSQGIAIHQLAEQLPLE